MGDGSGRERRRKTRGRGMEMRKDTWDHGHAFGLQDADATEDEPPELFRLLFRNSRNNKSQVIAPFASCHPHLPVALVLPPRHTVRRRHRLAVSVQCLEVRLREYCGSSAARRKSCGLLKTSIILRRRLQDPKPLARASGAQHCGCGCAEACPPLFRNNCLCYTSRP